VFGTYFRTHPILFVLFQPEKSAGKSADKSTSQIEASVYTSKRDEQTPSHVFVVALLDLKSARDDSTYSHHMKDARFTIPNAGLLAKVFRELEALLLRIVRPKVTTKKVSSPGLGGESKKEKGKSEERKSEGLILARNIT
jgi:hypothetical protein